MKDQNNDSSNLGDETMKGIGALEEATNGLEDATAKRVADGEDAKSWIRLIVESLLLIFKPVK